MSSSNDSTSPLETNGKAPWPWWVRALLYALERYGAPTIVTAYFLFKDWYFTADLIILQTKIAVALDKIAHTLK